MFNALESVANRRHPATPVLGCRMSKALEPHFVKDDVGDCVGMVWKVLYVGKHSIDGSSSHLCCIMFNIPVILCDAYVFYIGSMGLSNCS